MDHQVIWVVSYPKSGSTWVRTLLKHYLQVLTGTKPLETSDTIPYFYHIVSPKPAIELGVTGIAQLRPAALMHLIAVHQSRTHPTPATIIKSHLFNATIIGMPLWSPLWAPKVVYISRDPRDILPSYADHLGETHEEIVKLMTDPSARIGTYIPALTSTWSNHVKSWHDAKNVEVCHISYEQMHEDTAGVLSKVLDFYDIENDPIIVDMAVEASSFRVMQEREARQGGFCERTEHQKRFFRRGIVGSHKIDVEEFHTMQIEHDHEDMMRRLGYLDE